MGLSQQQMTFSTETDASFGRRTVIVLSSIPPILIVTVVISISVFPPDFWRVPALGTRYFSPAHSRASEASKGIREIFTSW